MAKVAIQVPCVEHGDMAMVEVPCMCAEHGSARAGSIPECTMMAGFPLPNASSMTLKVTLALS